jgi:hypothetical protein
MIRATASVCVLFGSLLLVSRFLQQSVADERPPMPVVPAAVNSSGALEDGPLLIGPRIARSIHLSESIAAGATDESALQKDATDIPDEPANEVAPAFEAADAANDKETEAHEKANAELTAKNPAKDDPAKDDLEKDDTAGKSDDSASTDKKATIEQPSEDADSVPLKSQATRELTPELIELRDRLRDCLDYYYHRPENVAERSPWGIMHALIAYGVDTQIYTGGHKVNAIGWLCWNGNCRGQNLLYTVNGKLKAREGPGVQGHAGQFLAMLAQSRVKTDYPIKVDGHDFTVADLIEYEKLTCKAGTELTFKLIALAHYLEVNETWKNQYGEEWDIPRLIREELGNPVVGGACGGTHRMTGFSYAVHKREKSGEPMDGQWLRAKKFVDSYHDYTFSIQNADGSMSTDWFRGRGDYGDAARRLETTGHMTEWLVYSLPEDQLTDPRVVKAVDYLTNLLLQKQNWSIGPKGHGLHALVIYDQRVFGAKPGQRTLNLAKTGTNSESK